jgi:hypothetical protein
VTPEKLLERLRRVEQQIRAFKELHSSELQIILDELSDITSELTPPREPSADEPAAAHAPDGGAASPKRAKWLAEQERKAQPMSRREFLRGRDDEGGAKP